MLKRSVSILLTFILVLGCFSALPTFADTDVPVEVYSITASPQEAVINTQITYTVTTSTSATKVQILNPDKSIHTAAYISAGFTDYVDNGDIRTWTIKKRNQVTFNGHRRAVAKGDDGGKYSSFNKAPYSENIIVKVNASSEPDEYIPATPSVEESEHNLLSGSFLQGWLCRDWSLERWNSEFAAMKDVGMDHMILQSVYDWALYSNGGVAQDWEAYTTNTRYSLYPTEIEGLKGANLTSINNGDELEYALMAAKENGMKIYIGLLSDDRWWKYGWGVPVLPTGKTDPATESYFATWCEYNGDLAAQMIVEIWERYGEEYGEQIAGWYYYNEIWNIDVGCKRTDNMAYATCIGNNMNIMLDAINEVCPEKPMMLSPFYNQEISTPEEYKNFWTDIFSVANFRAGDIFAPQDSVGAKNIPIEDLDEWIGGLKEAANTEEGLRFWVNNENFTSGLASAPVSRLIQQIEATDPYAETHITFSWNHYYNPVYNANYATYNNELKAYLEQRASEE